MYQLNFDERAGLLEITLSGFWTVETVRSFHRDYLEMISRYRLSYPSFPTLSDSRELAVLSSEASQAFIEGSREAAELHSGRVAVVFGSHLAKMQADRRAQELAASGVDRSKQGYFTDMDLARRWALEGVGT